MEREVLEQIALDSLGSARQALVVLEKVIGLPADRQLQVARKQAEQLNQVIELCRELIGRSSWPTIAGILKGIQKEEPEQIRRAVMGYCRAVLLGGRTCDAKVTLVLNTFRDTNLYSSGFDGLVGLCAEIVLEN